MLWAGAHKFPFMLSGKCGVKTLLTRSHAGGAHYCMVRKRATVQPGIIAPAQAAGVGTVIERVAVQELRRSSSSSGVLQMNRHKVDVGSLINRETSPAVRKH